MLQALGWFLLVFGTVLVFVGYVKRTDVVGWLMFSGTAGIVVNAVYLAGTNRSAVGVTLISLFCVVGAVAPWIAWRSRGQAPPPSLVMQFDTGFYTLLPSTGRKQQGPPRPKSLRAVH